MARIQAGPLVSDASGRAAGLIFRRTRFGLVAQGAPKVVVHTSAAALLRKQYFRIAMQAWRSLPGAYQSYFKQRLKDDNKGIPGPWITAFQAYASGGAFVWNYVQQPDQKLGAFVSVNIGPVNWTVYFASKPANCSDAHIFLFNDAGGSILNWIYAFAAGASPIWGITRKPLPGTYKGIIIPSRLPPYTQLIAPATFSIIFP